MGSLERSIRSYEQEAGLGQLKRAHQWPELGLATATTTAEVDQRASRPPTRRVNGRSYETHHS